MNKKLILKILRKIFKEYSCVEKFERDGNKIIYNNIIYTIKENKNGIKILK